MDERYKRVKRLFLEVHQLDSVKRKEVLDRECAEDEALRLEVESLVVHGQIPPERLETVPPPEPPRATLPAGNGDRKRGGLPARIGPYRIMHEIDRCEMGVVYLARRDDDVFRSQVAVKVVRRDKDTDDVLRRTPSWPGESAHRPR